MSNYLAVATVTAALRGILRPAVISDVSGADVTIGRPQAFTSTPAPAVNIFLYRSQPHPAMRNEDLPTLGFRSSSTTCSPSTETATTSNQSACSRSPPGRCTRSRR